MRFIITFILMAYMVVVPAMHADAARNTAVRSYNAGDILPDQEFTNIHGSRFKISDVKAPLVLLHHWASWCAPCILEFPKLIEMLKHFDGDIQMIAISLDTQADAMHRYMDSLGADGLGIRWVHDTEFKYSSLYGIPGVPHTFFLSPQRRVLKKVFDEYDWNGDKSRNELTKMISDIQSGDVK